MSSPDEIRADAARYAALLVEWGGHAERRAIEARYNLYGWRAAEVPRVLRALADTLDRELGRWRSAVDDAKEGVHEDRYAPGGDSDDEESPSRTDRGDSRRNR